MTMMKKLMKSYRDEIVQDLSHIPASSTTGSYPVGHIYLLLVEKRARRPEAPHTDIM